MKPIERLSAVLAMFGVCMGLAPSHVRAQSAQPAAVQTGGAETPATRMLRQSITRETRHVTLVPAERQTPPAKERSWVSRHKVLTAVLIGVTPFVIWGAMVWNTCSGGGC